MTLLSWVSPETLNLVGFNAGEPSFVVSKQYNTAKVKGKCGLGSAPGSETVYHAVHGDLNLVVVERHGLDGRREYFLGKFGGKPPYECAGDEISRFVGQAGGVVQRKNRVAGRNLEQAILDAVGERGERLYIFRAERELSLGEWQHLAGQLGCTVGFFNNEYFVRKRCLTPVEREAAGKYGLVLDKALGFDC